MIPFSGRCEYRQYVPSKPNPLGLKNFVLAARDGVVLDFEIYVGSNTLPPQNMADLGLGAGIVKLLCRTVDETCVLYTDRFFTSIKLADYLIQNKKDVYLTGTVMTNRIGSVSKKLTTDKQLKRGEWDEKVRNDEEVSVLKWKDTKAVTMLSTCIGGSPIGSCKRWCKVEKKKIDVAQPAVVKNYNTCMGGIDLCDRLIAYYRSSMRTRRWPVRAFSHFVDLAIVNCWIMYTRCCNHEGITAKDKLGLLQYRLNLATAMAKYDGGIVNPIYSRSNSRGGADTDSREIPSTSRNQDEPPKKKPRAIVAQPRPDKDLKIISYLGFPTLDEIKAGLASAKCFTTLDADKDFWTSKPNEQSSKLCTFITPYGRYRFTRLPFGIINAVLEMPHNLINYDPTSLSTAEIPESWSAEPWGSVEGPQGFRKKYFNTCGEQRCSRAPTCM
ncbi:PiggyBac transposable element-derived protein 3 [Eumeta japonica]|uniref:PiggyBac transposable element-derived protein 3 n=1 Tax=Eumeta variegata TaxID=151549 RepID=A0A4C1T5L1_EUMVA|nr:PiggyBac transposable element-derived protein 3 [Eumeta japonica]